MFNEGLSRLWGSSAEQSPARRKRVAATAAVVFAMVAGGVAAPAHAAPTSTSHLNGPTTPTVVSSGGYCTASKSSKTVSCTRSTKVVDGQYIDVRATTCKGKKLFSSANGTVIMTMTGPTFNGPFYTIDPALGGYTFGLGVGSSRAFGPLAAGDYSITMKCTASQSRVRSTSMRLDYTVRG